MVVCSAGAACEVTCAMQQSCSPAPQEESLRNDGMRLIEGAGGVSSVVAAARAASSCACMNRSCWSGGSKRLGGTSVPTCNLPVGGSLCALMQPPFCTPSHQPGMSGPPLCCGVGLMALGPIDLCHTYAWPSHATHRPGHRAQLSPRLCCLTKPGFTLLGCLLDCISQIKRV